MGAGKVAPAPVIWAACATPATRPADISKPLSNLFIEVFISNSLEVIAHAGGNFATTGRSL
jgi:hypothetical protein